jgi:hypothetical protein
VLGGVGALGLLSFTYFGLIGRAEAAELEDGCGRTKTCREDQVTPVRKKLIVADVSLSVGIMSLGAATYLYLTKSDGDPSPPPSVEADVSLGPSSGWVSVRGRF